jgi:hypothetical protein
MKIKNKNYAQYKIGKILLWKKLHGNMKWTKLWYLKFHTQIKLWSYPKLMLNKLKVMRSYLYLYLFGDLFQKKFYENFHMFVIQGTFLSSLLKSKWIKNEL